jgi:hypothetical protein
MRETFAEHRAFARPALLLCAALLASLVSACIPSLHPAYDASSLVPVEGIEGAWQGPEGSEIFFLSRRDDGLYRAVYLTEDAGSVGLEAGFTEIGDGTYVDFSLALPARLGNDAFVGGLIGAWHGIFRVTLEDDGSAMRLHPMSPSELDAALGSDPEALAHARTDRLRLLADTAALRAYIAHTPALFDTEGQRFERAG